MCKLIVIVLVACSFFTEYSAFKIQQSEVVTDQIDQIPYYAHLEVEVKYYGLLGKRSCGAVIIEDLWLLTTAYCLNNADRLTVQLGSSAAIADETLEPSHVIIEVEKTNFFKHPHYNRMMSWNDIGKLFFIVSNRFSTPQFNNHCFDISIGLIRLPKKVEFSRHIHPVRMPTTCENTEIGDAIAVGYKIDDSLFHSSKLQSISMKTLPKNSCGKWFSLFKHRNSIICANIQDHQSVWNGEKGSPLMKDDTLVGVLSFESRGGPNRFTNVCSYLDWIETKNGNHKTVQDFLSDVELGNEFGLF